METSYPVLSGALAQEKRMEMITNNLANVSTSGFKKDFAVIEGLKKTGLSAPPIENVATFGTLSRTVTDLSPGEIRTTGAPLDVAVEGDGFLSVQTPDGPRYTRNGHFTLDADGVLSLGKFPVLGSAGPIALPPGNVIINPDGTLYVKGTEEGAEPVEIDIIPIYQFNSAEDLRKVGETLFEQVNGVAIPSLEGRLRQGALEGSNVNPVEEMIAMIEVMRLYEAAQKAIQTEDQILAKSNEIASV